MNSLLFAAGFWVGAAAIYLAQLSTRIVEREPVIEDIITSSTAPYFKSRLSISADSSVEITSEHMEMRCGAVYVHLNVNKRQLLFIAECARQAAEAAKE